MQREVDFNPASVSVIASSDCETMKALSAFVDYLCKLFSWGLFVCLLLLYGIFRKSQGYEFFYATLLGLSLVSHLGREAVEVWMQFPCWIDVERRRKVHLSIASMTLLSGALLGFSLAVRGCWTTGVAAWLVMIFFEFFLSVSVGRHGEVLFRKFYELKSRGRNPILRTNDKSGGVPSAFSEVLYPEEDSVSTSDLSGIDDLLSKCDEGVRNEDGGLLISSQTRKRLNDREEISGEALVEFDDSSELAFLNLSFCPPFEEIPVLDFEQTSGEEVRVNVALVQTFGARLEIQRMKKTKALLEKDVVQEPVRLDYYASSKRPE